MFGEVKTKQRHTWIISDTHFDHMKMCEYCDRPPDFNQKIIHHWRAMIAPEDLVYHLGDVYFGKRSTFFDCVQSLPGVKILIRGNHDREKTNWYLNHGFTAAMDFAAVTSRTNVREKGEHYLYTRVLLSHRPMEIPKLGGHKTVNIHGHFHNHSTLQVDEAGESDLIKRLTTNHYLFSLEWTNYKPVLLDRAIRDNWVRRFSRKKRTWLKKN